MAPSRRTKAVAVALVAVCLGVGLGVGFGAGDQPKRVAGVGLCNELADALSSLPSPSALADGTVALALDQGFAQTMIGSRVAAIHGSGLHLEEILRTPLRSPTRELAAVRGELRRALNACHG